MNELQSQVTLALLVPFIMQWLKGQKWFPFLSMTSGKLNAFVAAAVAFLGGLGIAFTYNGTAHTLLITGLSWSGIWAGAVHFVQQWLMQQAAYRALIAPPQPGAVQAQERAAQVPPQA